MDMLWLVLSIATVQISAAPTRWIDLSYQFAENTTIYWPGQKTFEHDLVFSGAYDDLGTFVEAYKYAAGEHGGTHMDAPRHFIKDGITLEKIAIEQVVGDAVVINISSKVDQNPIAELDMSDLEAWEEKHGRIPDKALLFMYSGRGRFWPDRVKYFGSNTPFNESTLHFPGLHEKAAKWLVDERKIKLFGLDTPSFDHGQSKGFPTHKVLLGAGVPGIENVANLDRLPPKGAEVFAVPMKIKDGSGGPVRLFARIADKKVVNAGMPTNHKLSFVIAMVISLIFENYL